MSGEPDADMAGWAYFNEDTGMEWSRNHPIESGEVPDAMDVERMTYSGFRAKFGYDDWLDSPDQQLARTTTKAPDHG